MAEQSELDRLGDALDIAIVGEGARFWGVLQRREEKKCRSVPRIVMAGLAGSAAVQVLWSVLCRELSRRPQEFTPTIQSFAGAIVKEVGSILSVLPFEQRVEAWRSLSALLGQGLEIAFVNRGEDANAAETGRGDAGSAAGTAS